ncbi:MAG: hypothetical protein RR185_10020, partial [Angelakisella sp.]
PAVQLTRAALEVRKARTRRLIQVGAVTDQYLGTNSLSPEEVGLLLQALVQMPEVKEQLYFKQLR